MVVSLRDDSKFGDFVVFRSRVSPRDATSITLRLPRRCAPRNDTNLKHFCFGNKRLLFYAAFLRGDAPHRFYQTFRSETVSFSSKPYQICHCEEGIFNARRGNL